MKLVVISPEHDEPREHAVLSELFGAGLERYHVRKPDWPREKLQTWLGSVPTDWRSRLVLHSHHDLVTEFGLGGAHERDGSAGLRPALSSNKTAGGTPALPFISRSCHDLATLRAAFGHYDSVFFSPVFPSISKPRYAPRPEISFTELSSLLTTRTPAARRTSVLALGGINADTAPRALAFGFDGVAVLGAIWQARDPVQAFAEIQNSIACHVA